MKVYIQTDLEGVAGVVFFESRRDTRENLAHRRRMCRLLTGELDAAARGAFEAGASEVVINDSHGSCYNVLFEELDPRCEIIHGRDTNGCWLPRLDASFAALVLVGMHAMGGTSNAVLCHTRWVVNDGACFLGEAGMAAAVAGSFGVPTVFVSGDDRVAAELQGQIPGIETAVVKRALGPYQAQSRMPQAAQRLIQAGVRQGLARRQAIPPFVVPGPLKLNLLESAAGNHHQACGFRRALPEDVTAGNMHAALQLFLAQVPWYPGQAALPDGFEYP